MKIKVLFFAAFAAAIANVNAGCDYLSDAPVVEAAIPNLQQHTLKFLNVDATVYRHTLSKGSSPRLRILRYSSNPIIDVDDATNEIRISAEGDKCSKTSPGATSGALSKTSSLHLFVSSLLFATTPSRFRGLGFVAMMAMGMQSFMVDAADDDGCTPAMQVVLEAPPYYLGSVEECLLESEDPSHCPEPFPTFDTCTDSAPSCKLAVVGAGTGGLYTAMRLVETGKYSATDVCIFEATDRVGGRIYSLRGFGPDHDITVDAGAYRTWPEFTPTLHALVTEKLGFDVECYDEEVPCQVYNIIGESGQKIGFASFVEKMMGILIDDGACFYSRHELVSIEAESAESESIKKLSFANGVKATAEQVILNVPQHPLLKIMRKSDLPLTETESLAITDSLHSVQTEIAAKVYLYYENAWWLDLGLSSGEFASPGDARTMMLQGRYHDGHVKCTDEGCHGFLLADYVHDFSGDASQFFRRYQRDRPEPVTIISSTDTEGALFLEHAHSRISNYHIYEAQNVSYTGFQAQQTFRNAPPPEFAVLATWNVATFGAGGAWHHWTDISNVEQATMPMNHIGIHVVNEAYSRLQGWAEGSLMLADDVLATYFDCPRPWDFPAPDYVQFVRQTQGVDCAAEAEDSSSGGGGGDTGGGGGAGEGTVDLCFTKEALVSMADGTLVPIDEIEEGDVVSTGFAGESGTVTEVLVHKVSVSGEIDVVSVATDFGDLVGTPSHPIHINGQWVEMQEAVQAGMFETVGLTADFAKQEVAAFYNLEIDGDKAGQSSHSYVVNGIVASGLGDNQVLNTMFARQNEWKLKA
ncbi:MAG: hypothetical protein SGBAC_011930 [Bacillariaceae sp.]